MCAESWNCIKTKNEIRVRRNYYNSKRKSKDFGKPPSLTKTLTNLCFALPSLFVRRKKTG